MMSMATVSKAPQEMLKGTGRCYPWQYFLNLVRETQINQATWIKGSVDRETGSQPRGRELWWKAGFRSLWSGEGNFLFSPHPLQNEYNLKTLSG